MRKTAMIIVFAFVVVIGASAQQTYALLAGVSNYYGNAKNLGNTTKDVKNMKAVLEKQGAKVGMATSKYATKTNITNRLNAIVQLAKPKDKIIFFYAGHGNVGSFLVNGTDMNFTYEELVNILSKANTRNIFCFFDVCHAGSVAESGGANYKWGNGAAGKITFMMGCRADEVSWEDNLLGDGYFSKALLKGLRGKADSNGDRQITVMELFKYTYNDVLSRTKGNHEQHPQLIGPKSSYDTVLAKW